MTAADFIAFVAAFNSGMIVLNKDQALQLLKLILSHPDNCNVKFAPNGQPTSTVKIETLIDVSKITQVRELTAK